MRYGLISLLPLQLARLIGLVRSIEATQLQSAREEWVLLINGRGFTRLLRDEPMVAPNLIRPIGWDAPRPMTFRRKTDAEAFGRHVGLLRGQRQWAIEWRGGRSRSGTK